MSAALPATLADIELSSVNKPGSTVRLRKGDPVLVVETVSGGVYLRTYQGEIVDAANTVYAKKGVDVIDLD